MKNLFLTISILMLGSSNALATGWHPDNISQMSVTASTLGPLMADTCISKDGRERQGKFCAVVNAVNISYSASTTLLLLKDVKAAQPDALNYIAGAAPSPHLYSTVEKLQYLSSEELGQELTFDQAVDMIIDSL